MKRVWLFRGFLGWHGIGVLLLVKQSTSDATTRLGHHGFIFIFVAFPEL